MRTELQQKLWDRYIAIGVRLSLLSWKLIDMRAKYSDMSADANHRLGHTQARYNALQALRIVWIARKYKALIDYSKSDPEWNPMGTART